MPMNLPERPMYFYCFTGFEPRRVIRAGTGRDTDRLLVNSRQLELTTRA
jgi:hypothetical protein